MEKINTNDTFLEEKRIADKELKPNQPLVISPEGKSYLITTAKWSGFIAIIGFVAIGLLLISGITTFGLSSVVDEYRDFEIFQYYPMSMVTIGLTNIFTAILSFFPYLYLYIFAKRVKLGMLNDDQENLNEGFKNLKKMSKFVGILTIVLVAIMLLFIPTLFFSIGMLQALAGGTTV